MKSFSSGTICAVLSTSTARSMRMLTVATGSFQIIMGQIGPSKKVCLVSRSTRARTGSLQALDRITLSAPSCRNASSSVQRVASTRRATKLSTISTTKVAPRLTSTMEYITNCPCSPRAVSTTKTSNSLSRVQAAFPFRPSPLHQA